MLERVRYVTSQVFEVLLKVKNPPFTLMIAFPLHLIYSLSSYVRLFFSLFSSSGGLG